MIFPNQILVSKPKDDISYPNREHPPATTAFRKSCFYDRVLAEEFKKHFHFVYPDEEGREK